MKRSVFAAAGLEECFDYLADPRNRPQWQSSLRSIELLGPESSPAVGTRWRDVTTVGIRPHMEITRMEPLRLWQERGTWGGFEAWLTLTFAAVPGGTRIDAEATVTGRGPARLAAPVVRRLAPAAITSDLRRAARILAGGE